MKNLYKLTKRNKREMNCKCCRRRIIVKSKTFRVCVKCDQYNTHKNDRKEKNRCREVFTFD